MIAPHCSVGYSTIDTEDSVCMVHNDDTSTSDLERCCNGSQVQTTADGCLAYCQYDSSKLGDFTDCLGGGIVGAACQNPTTTNDNRSSVSSETTANPNPVTSATFSGSAARKNGWSKRAAAMLMLATASLSYAAGDPQLGHIRSCVDGQCNDCATGNGPKVDGESSWKIEYPYPQCMIYSSATFNGAESENGGGYDLWWEMGEPNPECQIIIMSPVGQDVAGTNCGNVVLASKSAGCYYTHLDSTFMVQYCCGSGDCAAAGVGGVKRDVQNVTELIARADAGTLDGDTFAIPYAMKRSAELIGTFDLNDKWNHQEDSWVEDSTGNSLTARAAMYAGKKLGRRAEAKCADPVNQGDSFTKSGTQTQVTPVLTCSSDSSCNQQVGKQISVAHTLISQRSHTFTVSGGIQVTVEVGTDFIIEAKSSVAVHAEVASAVEETTGTQDTRTVTSTINQVYSQVPGTSGYIWFTPTLNCQMKTLTCNGQEVEVEDCEPALLADGTQRGELGFTTTA